MDKFNFNNRPNAARIELTKNSALSDIDTEVVLQFLNFQWAYRGMQRQYDAVLTQHHLTESRFIILMFLSEATDQQLLPSEIADQLGATRATVSKLLRGMAADGWVQKRASETDKRATYMQLTPTGKATLDAFLPANFAAVKTLFGQLTPDELKTFASLLNKINQGTSNLKTEMES
ncbi:MarR family transcriptional regulator [Secundilactobacillus paracollinoides]|uniref:MarR family transcriptional regulator n=1 Tax=Secundilactobacillus paracollinoides TaxID=240427 RepID=A0A1B2IWC3_9LACO|nr:MarR family transcriptional regulator [Secundilactobacillus paracollinoides]ANZ60515.1 MarR family transcriptional regulator [Secundilactobacillus paracollinoides]ANZ64826.1 MarR family transcriptional regulator [Secundilactobacillus paracollinoides]ANZ66342.1 MarR family transcriptional regulator [Secundilactobacillus paracollinoides]KRL79690.1 transcriptional regulator [Secundilactobacillus paracollinoides DSM 15502 = JCM 11969]